MKKEDREQLISSGFIKEKSVDGIPSKDRRYDLVWVYCGKEESICRSRTWIYCDTVQKRKEALPQYKLGKFEKKRVK